VSEKDPPQLKCNLCPSTFETIPEFLSHLTTAHPIQNYVESLRVTVDAALRIMGGSFQPPIDRLGSTLNTALRTIGKDVVNAAVVPDLTPDLTKVKEIREKCVLPSTIEVPEEVPYTPEKVYSHKNDVATRIQACVELVNQGVGYLNCVPFVQAGGTIDWALKAPWWQAQISLATRFFNTGFEYGQLPYLQRYWQRKYQPFLPSYSDMISIYVREGYMAEKWVEIPAEFTEYMKELGYSEDWTKRLWGKHWVLVGVDHLYEMFHKKIIDYKTMVQMLKFHDFEPVWRDRLIANAYTMIPRVDIRRAYVWGLLREEQLQERYEWLGYSPADAILMKDIAIRFGLSAYYSRRLTVACQAFRKGQLEGSAFQEILEECGLPEDAQDLILEAETLAREIGAIEPGEEPRTLTASQVCGAYTKGLLSLSAAKDQLLRMGYLEGDADLLLALAAPKPVSEAPATEIVSAASLLYRNGWMSPEEFDVWLHKANLTPEEIQVTKDAQDLRYWFDYASDLLALWKQMYAKDLITLDEFYTNLLRWGCQPDRAWAIVSLEETRKIPKPRAAG